MGALHMYHVSGRKAWALVWMCVHATDYQGGKVSGRMVCACGRGGIGGGDGKEQLIAKREKLAGV